MTQDSAPGQKIGSSPFEFPGRRTTQGKTQPTGFQKPVDLIEKCSVVDGTWGMKTQYHDLSLKWAKPLLDAVEAATPDIVATDCPLSALRIFEGTGRRPVHPVQVLLQAYGL